MRTLIVIPIIHAEQDMGSLLEQTRLAYVKKNGEEKWINHLKSVSDFWLGIGQIIKSLDPHYASVRLYQDGLPVCGKEEQIVKEVAAQGSKNYQLLLELMTLGSQLMGTEDSDLLVQEYRFHQSTPRAVDSAHAPERIEQSRQLLLKRDRFIANRINTTLLVDEVGLLFLGLAHSVSPQLAPDINVRQMLPSMTGNREERLAS